MSFSAVIPLADMAAANQTLEGAGFGPRNFSVPVYTGAIPSYATMHSWPDPAFIAAVKAIPNVTWSETTGTPADRVKDALSGVGGEWGGDAPELSGVVTPGLYRSGEDLWWVIQQYDTAIWPDPAAIPALIRKARVPSQVEPWVQPLDQFDAYKLVNPFTGEPDQVTHNGQTWRVVQADGAGNNVWEPGVFGWEVV